MEKTINNIKKILHIGPKISKDENDYGEDKKKLKEKVLTTKVELSKKDFDSNKQNGSPVKVPIASEDVGDNDLDCIRCEGCSKAMKNGYEITLSNGLCWHYSCFQCDSCSVDLSHTKYAYERECLLCEPCLQSRVKTTCHKCVMIIQMEDTKLIVDGKEFHAACFCCVVCSVKLDKIYGSKDGDYYCEDCYVDRFGKKCARCSQVIIGSGLRFGSDNYHKDCFTCSQCSKTLEQGAVQAIKQKPVCTTCYEQQFLETCMVCKLQVSEGLKFREERFHPECFKCRSCSLPLADRKGEFLLTEEGLQCKSCVKITMSEDIQSQSVTENCVGCELPIHVKNLVFDGEKNWHYKCFSCSQCNTGLVNQKYYDKEGKLFCNNCFLAKYLPTCFNCKEELKGRSGVKMSAVSGQVLTWHEDCLQCSVCKARVALDNVVFRDNLFCKTCYLDTMLNKCDACMKSITGVGYTFRGKFWHDTCFSCDQCHNVFQEGKFRNLREQKLCDTCFRAATKNS